MKLPRSIITAIKAAFVAALVTGVFFGFFAILAGFVFAVSCAWHSGAS